MDVEVAPIPVLASTPSDLLHEHVQRPRRLCRTDSAVDRDLSAETDRLLLDGETNRLLDDDDVEVDCSASSPNESSLLQYMGRRQPKRLRTSTTPKRKGGRLDAILLELQRNNEENRLIREDNKKIREENKATFDALTSRFDGAVSRMTDAVATIDARTSVLDVRVGEIDERQLRSEAHVGEIDERQLRTEALVSNHAARIDAQQIKFQEQLAAFNNERKLVVRNVPTARLEPQAGLRAIVMKLAEAVGFNLTSRGIRYVRQMHSEARRSSTLFVDFDDRAARTGFFGAYLQSRSLSARDLGYNSSTRIYVGEMLTKATNELRANAVKLLKAGRLKAVQTSSGSVWVTGLDGRKRKVTSMAELGSCSSGNSPV